VGWRVSRTTKARRSSKVHKALFGAAGNFSSDCLRRKKINFVNLGAPSRLGGAADAPNLRISSRLTANLAAGVTSGPLALA